MDPRESTQEYLIKRNQRMKPYLNKEKKAKIEQQNCAQNGLSPLNDHFMAATGYITDKYHKR